MTVLLQDLRFAVRTLLRSRGFTVVALLTLALGIGVNTAMFSVAHAVLWRSFPYPHPDRLVMVGEVDAHDPDNYWGASWPNLLDWRSRATSFEHLAGVMRRSAHSARRRELRSVSPAPRSLHDFFQVMGVAPLMGRFFGEAEDRQGVPAVIVLSHRMWTELLGGDPAVSAARSVSAKTPYTVIGVMPAGFEYRQAEFWTPLQAGDGSDGLRPTAIFGCWTRWAAFAPESHPLPRPGKWKPSPLQIRQDHPETRRGLVVRAVTLPDALSRDLRPALLVLLGAVGFLLLIACGNIAGLMLVRGTARAREMAIRRALGVGYARLVRQLLTESAVLAVAGGRLGIGLAFLATRSLGLLTRDPSIAECAHRWFRAGFCRRHYGGDHHSLRNCAGDQRRARRRRRSAPQRNPRGRLPETRAGATDHGDGGGRTLRGIARRSGPPDEELSPLVRSQPRLPHRAAGHPASRSASELRFGRGGQCASTGRRRKTCPLCPG